MRGSKFPADMHNYIWCPIYIPRFMIIGSVVSEELRWQDFGTDGRTDGRSDCTPRPAFAFGDAGKKGIAIFSFVASWPKFLWSRLNMLHFCSLCQNWYTISAKTSSLTLIFDHVNWKLFARVIHCTKFGKDQQFDLDLWPCDLKISKVNYSLRASSYHVW